MRTAQTIIPAFGTAISGGQSAFCLTASPGTEDMSLLVFIFDKDLNDIPLEWELVHPDDGNDTEAILATGEIQDLKAQRAHYADLSTGPVGYHRLLQIRFVGTIPPEVAAMGEALVLVRFRPMPRAPDLARFGMSEME